ncbi:signal peptide peptidase SppA [Empedobacter falsenii]|uniref:signal peptide peptidase SppA n=1 Tax=Empedobacter falsenii TaxID=343874 RepID=UPI002577D4F2|nr:signal peptide peptidase SppA [Empedobacter falsenii]MDM1297931.1 signal peptide peptidase SppA [Empedobacter falsenii]MDM1317441.1 signal peptide peptidase SppA [Empedobacter falsenii]
MKNFFGRVFSTIIGNLLTISVFVILLFVLIFVSALSAPTKSVKDGSVLEISLEDPIMESDMDRSVSIFDMSEDPDVFLQDIIHSIEEAKNDDKIKGISLKLDKFSGGATQATDIRNALEDFKKSGKFVYSYSNSGSQLSYYISTVSDKIYQNPLGGTLLQGLSSNIMFFKNAGDKYGVDFQVIRHGQFKSAVEPYLRTNMSNENRLQLSELLNDVWGNVSNSITKSRKISPEQFTTVTDSLYAFIPEIGKENKIYDVLAQENEYQKMLFTKLGLKEEKSKTDFEVLEKHTIKVEDYFETLSDKSEKDKIAVLYASGTISEGDGFDGIQSKTYVDAIRKISQNDKIKALVLRVNSPGGSANASEEILYELMQLKTKMPIVVSFGDVAASGGYYIAQASDKIYAQPNTITGSIGVFGMIPNAQKLFNNFGLDFDEVKTNANADQLKDVMTPMSATAKNTMQKSIVLIYGKFVNHVATNRKLTYEQVDKIGEGRVWSGTRAKQIGLVDDFGSLDTAIKEAAKLAKIEKYSTENYPKRKDSFEEFMDNLQGKNTEAAIAKELGSDGIRIYKEIKMMNEQKGVQVRLPYDIQIQ